MMRDVRCGNPECPKLGRCDAACIEQWKAELEYPHHHPETALANYRAGREIYDTNGDLW